MVHFWQLLWQLGKKIFWRFHKLLIISILYFKVLSLGGQGVVGSNPASPTTLLSMSWRIRERLLYSGLYQRRTDRICLTGDATGLIIAGICVCDDNYNAALTTIKITH